MIGDDTTLIRSSQHSSNPPVEFRMLCVEKSGSLILKDVTVAGGLLTRRPRDHRWEGGRRRHRQRAHAQAGAQRGRRQSGHGSRWWHLQQGWQRHAGGGGAAAPVDRACRHGLCGAGSSWRAPPVRRTRRGAAQRGSIPHGWVGGGDMPRSSRSRVRSWRNAWRCPSPEADATARLFPASSRPVAAMGFEPGPAPTGEASSPDRWSTWLSAPPLSSGHRVLLGLPRCPIRTPAGSADWVRAPHPGEDPGDRLPVPPRSGTSCVKGETPAFRSGMIACARGSTALGRGHLLFSVSPAVHPVGRPAMRRSPCLFRPGREGKDIGARHRYRVR